MGSIRTVSSARELFQPAGVYLNTASAGLPPDTSWDQLQIELARSRDGTADIAGYDSSVELARGHFARLVGTDVDRVAVGNQTSVFFGMIAGSLPDGAEILTAIGDFASLTFPFRAQHRFTVRAVPLATIADEITPSTTAVAVSAIQSADGAVADLDSIAATCAATGCLSLIDATQASGWLPLRVDDFDITVTSGYKWLLAPRGTAFMTVRPELTDRIVPFAAGWYAAADRWSDIYGSSMQLAAGSRRFDISPAWHSWVAAAPALELLADIGSGALHRHATGLADDFRAAVGLPAGGSAIVSVQLLPRAAERVLRAGVVGAMRAGKLRLSFHLNNSADDAAAAVEALSGYLMID
jgi:selenocysteine lyase/cysteine desulfurase